MTYEEARAVLQQRGVTWQRLETWGEDGLWKFTCAIPNAKNPNIRRTYEAQAPDAIAVLRAVIEQIDRDR